MEDVIPRLKAKPPIWKCTGEYSDRSAETIQSICGLAVTLENEGRYPEAEKLAREALSLSEQTAGAEDPDTLDHEHSRKHFWAAKAATLRLSHFIPKVLEIRRRVLGPEHPDTLYTMHGLATDFRGERKYAEAGEARPRDPGPAIKILGPEHQSTLGSMRDLARDYVRQGKFQEAGEDGSASACYYEASARAHAS